MTRPKLDIVAIGDAIVDVIATCEDSFLDERGLVKGAMRLLTVGEADDLYSAMGPARESSGGSAANSMAGAAALGLDAAFVGQVANDQLGAIFTHDMNALGIAFDTPPICGAEPTGRCLILVSPDAQRTMNTCPGASHELTVEALDTDVIRSASITFLEGYLWGPDRPRAAMIEAARIAKASGKKVAFTLSESLALQGGAEGVVGMIDDGLVDLLFGNENEMIHLTGCGDLATCIDTLARKVGTVVITRGASGAIATEANEVVEIAAVRVDQIVDTTGAGDLFAAGFLAGRCRGRDLKGCLDVGARAAAEVISHFGARPSGGLEHLLGA